MEGKFKLGDLVKVVKGGIGKGTIGKVIEIEEKWNYPYKIKFKKNQGHNHIWMWFNEEELQEKKDGHAGKDGPSPEGMGGDIQEGESKGGT